MSHWVYSFNSITWYHYIIVDDNVIHPQQWAINHVITGNEYVCLSVVYDTHTISSLKKIIKLCMYCWIFQSVEPFQSNRLLQIIPHLFYCRVHSENLHNFAICIGSKILNLKSVNNSCMKMTIVNIYHNLNSKKYSSKSERLIEYWNVWSINQYIVVSHAPNQREIKDL